MAEGKKNEEVVLMTASLARLLRQSISNEDEVVPIANEVEYARGYLTIQKMRYKDKLEFQIEVEPSILHIPLIKLVLQPIIENAIYHGLKYKESKGLLIIKGFMKDGNAVLQVIDDGVGMDEKRWPIFMTGTRSTTFERCGCLQCAETSEALLWR